MLFKHISAIQTIFFGVAQLVDAVISSVVEVLSLNPGLGLKNFSAFNGIVDLLYLSISVFKSV